MAVGAKTGDFAWRVPLGVNEALPKGKRNTGSPSAGGPMATAGTIFHWGGRGAYF